MVLNPPSHLLYMPIRFSDKRESVFYVMDAKALFLFTLPRSPKDPPQVHLNMDGSYDVHIEELLLKHVDASLVVLSFDTSDDTTDKYLKYAFTTFTPRSR